MENITYKYIRNRSEQM
uniref:Uncharacterized protein n=1 Tax=Rhizophora mucronata TaxID=61149 RepID=A0A2P2IVR9_RHIMU